MSYDFTDTTQIGTVNELSIHQLVFNGLNFDDHFTDDKRNFITLSVTGRGIAQRRHKADSPDGFDGAQVESVSYEPRTLQVKVLVRAVDNAEFRNMLSEINLKLFTANHVDIQFTDEPFVFTGYFLNSSEPEEDSNEQIITLNFFCPKPFKRDQSKRSLRYTNGGTLNVVSDFAVRPNLKLVFPSAISEATISNTTTGDVLRIKRSTGTTATYLIELDPTITFGSNVSGLITKNKLEHLLLNSDFASFNIKSGDRVVVQPEPTTIDIQYKGVKL